MIRKRTGWFVACAAILMSGAARGQDVFIDRLRERADEHRLRHDYRVLHRDLAHGRTAAVQSDMLRIQQDQAALTRDLAQLNYDRNGGRAVPPNPNISGVNPTIGGLGYPSSIPSPQSMLAPLPQPISPAMLPPVNPTPSGVELVPSNPLPGLPQTLGICNPASTGVTLNYVFAGQTYSIESGRTQEFTVTTPTIIVFNRGGQAGVARSMLTPGNTFEFRSDSSGWFIAQKRPDLADLPQNPVPRSPSTNPIPAPDVTTSSLPALSPMISQP